MEHSALYNAINHDLTIFGPENTTVHGVVVASFACPSDPESGYPRELAAGALEPYAPDPPGGRGRMVFTSDSACYGSIRVDAIPRSSDGCRVPGLLRAQVDGAINDLCPIGFAAIADGLSHTLFVVERSSTAMSRFASAHPTLSDLHGWYVSGNWGDTLATTFYPPNAIDRVAGLATDALLNSATSEHPDGLNALMGDGSVRFIRDSVQSWPFKPTTGEPIGARRDPGGWWAGLPRPGVWQALATRAGGEILGDD